MSKLKDMFFNPKPVGLITYLNREKLEKDEKYAQKASRDIDTTYAHTVKMIDKMVDRGLIEKDKIGRKNVLELTEDGERIAEKLEEAKQVMEDAEE